MKIPQPLEAALRASSVSLDPKQVFKVALVRAPAAINGSYRRFQAELFYLDLIALDAYTGFVPLRAYHFSQSFLA